MTSFKEIRQACDEEGISIREIDRFLLNADSADEFYEMVEDTNIQVSHYATVEGPTVRTVDGPEKLVYVNERGYEVEVEL